MLKYSFIVASLVVLVALVLGCDDRGTGITRTEFDSHLDSAWIWPQAETSFADYLTMQLRNPREQLLATAFIPAEAVPLPPRKPIPMLILLAPENGNKWHYFKAGLGELAKDLMARGEIQPMVIYCIGNDQTFGGFFYANSDPGGRYDSIFTDDGTKNTLIRWLHETFPATIETSNKRGIGGVGQGAYGAFRAAITHPGMFTSITVSDGPLDFDGPDGNSGLVGLFDDVLAEQAAFHDSDPINTQPFDFQEDFDSTHSLPLSMMFIGGAFAFSPNDTLIDFDRIISGDQLSFNVVVNNTFRISDNPPPEGGEWPTFITSLMKPSPQTTRNLDLDFHLPFDANGDIYQPIWDMWLANNLEELHGTGSNVLSDMNIWVASTPSSKWNYYQMTQSWLDFLRAEGYTNITEYNYGAYVGDDPVQEDEYLFDILREMLIFHSEAFGD